MHWRRKWQITPVFLPGESQGRGSPVGCRLWGHTDSDTTEATQQQQRLSCLQRGCPVCCRMFERIPGHSRWTKGSCPFPVMTINKDTESPPVEDRCIRPTRTYTRLILFQVLCSVTYRPQCIESQPIYQAGADVAAPYCRVQAANLSSPPCGVALASCTTCLHPTFIL